MKRILFCLLLTTALKSQNFNRVPLTILLPVYNQSQEDSVKNTLNSSTKYYHIWNTTLSAVRIFHYAQIEMIYK